MAWPVLPDLLSLRNDIENSRFRFHVNPDFVYLFKHVLARLRSMTFFKKTYMSGHNSTDKNQIESRSSCEDLKQSCQN